MHLDGLQDYQGRVRPLGSLQKTAEHPDIDRAIFGATVTDARNVGHILDTTAHNVRSQLRSSKEHYLRHACQDLRYECCCSSLRSASQHLARVWSASFTVDRDATTSCAHVWRQAPCAVSCFVQHVLIFGVGWGNAVVGPSRRRIRYGWADCKNVV